MLKAMSTRKAFVFSLLVVGAALTAYLPALQSAFFWDDDVFITHNPQMHSPHGLAQIWMQPTSSPHYYPLLLTVFWVLVRLFGDWAFGFHLVNVLLHAANAFLLCRLGLRIGIRYAWLGAMIFLLHPINVQSVAWVTEMKNTLSTLFMLAACLVWVGRDKEKAPSIGEVRWWLVTLLFGAAMLTKSTSLILLLAFVLLEVVLGRSIRSRSFWVALMPLLVTGVAFALFSAWLERTIVGGGIVQTAAWWEKVGIASWSIFFYLQKLLVPVSLAPVYQNPALTYGSALVWTGLLALGLASAIFWGLRKSWRPLAALIFFTAFLFPIPFIGIAFTRWYGFVTDHFVYVPALVFCLNMASLAGCWAERGRARTAKLVLFASVIVLLGLLCFRHAEKWRDGSIWERAAANAPQSLAVLNYAGYLSSRGQLDEALPLVEKIYAKLGNKSFIVQGFGSLLAALGKTAEAEKVMRAGLEANPNDLQLWRAFATLMVNAGQLDEAVSALRKSVPANPSNRIALVSALLRAGRLNEARAEVPALPAPTRNNVNLLADLAAELSATKAYAEAEALLSSILHRFPLGHRARIELAYVQLDTGRVGEAQEQFSQALTFVPANTAAISGLAECMQRQGRSDKAASLLERAVSSFGEDPELRNSYAWFLSTCPVANFRDPAKAMQQLQSIDSEKMAANHYFQGTLAATLASQGDYAGAVAAAQRAIALGEAAGDKLFVAGTLSRLDLYRAGRPYVLPVASKP
jgi:tetratricopeptide (TPR) repeat protein